MEALSKSPKDVLALGQAIVRELELDARGNVLERWLAHHLAELMVQADTAVGPAKAAAEQQAVDLILKLWMHRRALPAPADPLGGFREAITVLGHLLPDADPWARYRRDGPYEALLKEMFESMSRVIAGGLLLTHFSSARSISEAEANALEQEEALLHEAIERWVKLLSKAPEQPSVEIGFVDSDAADELENESNFGEAEDDDLASDQQVPTEASIHSAVAANLERMRADLGKLLARWRSIPPEGLVPDEDEEADAGDEE